MFPCFSILSWRKRFWVLSKSRRFHVDSTSITLCRCWSMARTGYQVRPPAAHFTLKAGTLHSQLVSTCILHVFYMYTTCILHVYYETTRCNESMMNLWYSDLFTMTLPVSTVPVAATFFAPGQRKSADVDSNFRTTNATDATWRARIFQRQE